MLLHKSEGYNGIPSKQDYIAINSRTKHYIIILQIL